MRRNDVSRRTLICRSALGIAGAFGASAASTVRAQTVPHRLRILCGSGAGGMPDAVARIYAEAFNSRYPDGVLIDNRPGAAGQIAISALKRSAPDGTAMLLTHGAVATVYPSLYRKLPYDPVLDLAPVSLAGETGYGIAVGPLVPERVQRLDAFVDWAHEHAWACSYGTPGVGTLPHLLGATLFRDSGIEAQHVPYTTGSLAVADTLAGRISAGVLPEGLLRSYHDAGRLRILATSGDARSRFIRNTPTLAEQGHPSPFSHGWFGFFMPGAAPQKSSNRCRRQSRPSRTCHASGRRSTNSQSRRGRATLRTWPGGLRPSVVTGKPQSGRWACEWSEAYSGVCS